MPTGDSPTKTVVVLEIGAKRVFASALEWPGWCRSGKGEAAALDALANYAPRYAPVAREAGLALPEAPITFEVVERMPGSMMTDFGAPGAIAAREQEPPTSSEADRLAALVAATWVYLDRVVDAAPAELRKGPRGGGRNRDKVVEHVLGGEQAYARKLGVRSAGSPVGDATAIAGFRAAILAALRTGETGAPLRGEGWPARYAARRMAWHVLDHAWEIEDRSEPT